jgi:hypothetical protein
LFELDPATDGHNQEEQIADPTNPSHSPQPKVAEFSSVIKDFEVIDRNGDRIGTVQDVSLGRTCILVESGRSWLFGRKQAHGVHVSAVKEVDLDSFAVSLAVTTDDVAEAPDFRQLDPECETTLARHYHDRLLALGENDNAEARKTD